MGVSSSQSLDDWRCNLATQIVKVFCSENAHENENQYITFKNKCFANQSSKFWSLKSLNMQMKRDLEWQIADYFQKNFYDDHTLQVDQHLLIIF